ncbi:MULTISPECIES: LysR substrate-binding domain-containing protein [Ramlibacter]|uniref:LysR family transcriptional regulator n=1 Tax=Ramlibacter pinisoli TaxID=2682844 RepID=A0A6N8IZT2_9BURK|nr:LysR family transcriptional regulator [Ramlibacter sp. CGMCC 1.13660]MVQ32551.1 LysR family transcriptional regulator [Ramlibacter pinisoli]
MKITFRQVEVFLALSSTLSFSEAARISHLSQPALSVAIKRLEEVLGARLFERTTRHVALTAVGMEFQRLAQQLAGNVEQAQIRIREFAAGKRGRLTIAAGPSVAAGFLPAVMGEFSRRLPEVELRLHDELSGICLEMVRTGKADIAVTPAMAAGNGLAAEDLFRDYLVAIFPAGHPLCAKRTLKWADLQAYPQVAVNNTSHLRQTLNEQYQQLGHVFVPAYEVAQVPTMLGLISEGLGIGVLSEALLVRSNLEGLAHRRISTASAYRRICASIPAGSPPTPIVASFLETCREFARKRPVRKGRAA